MGRRNRHEKLSDVYGRAQPFLGGPRVPFLEAFPEVETLEISVTEHGYQPLGTTHMTQERVYPVVDCTNPVCAHGGIRVEPMLRQAIRSRETTIDESSLCVGYEGSPKGRIRRRKCLHSFEVKGSITYRT